jgi:DNA-directed RNA polymerase subunit beta'
MRKVRVENPGDTDFLPNEVVDKFRFREENDRMNKVARIKETGDGKFAVNSIVTRADIKEANAKIEADGGEPIKALKARPATAKTLLLGITKASLQSESFLSGASFQETTKVLTEAALASKVDNLIGLKENVLLGHLIPAGTGFKPYTAIRVRKLAEPPAAEAPTREELLEDAAALAEAAGAESPDKITQTVGQSSRVAELLDGQLAGSGSGKGRGE